MGSRTERIETTLLDGDALDAATGWKREFHMPTKDIDVNDVARIFYGYLWSFATARGWEVMEDFTPDVLQFDDKAKDCGLGLFLKAGQSSVEIYIGVKRLPSGEVALNIQLHQATGPGERTSTDGLRPILNFLAEANRKSYGMRLAAARRTRKLTQAELAEELGVTGATVSRWESDKSEPDTKAQSLLAGLALPVPE